MTEAGVREVRDHLSEYLRRVREGEQVVITDRGRPVAVLSAVSEGPATRSARAMVARGLASWGGGKPSGSRRPVAIPGRRAEEIVREDRR